jgi:hypothetical protein
VRPTWPLGGIGVANTARESRRRQYRFCIHVAEVGGGRL